MPGAIPAGFLKTPQEEFALNKVFIDQATADRLPHVTLIWHPWSLAAFDPDMTMLDMTFKYVRERGLEGATFAALAARL